MLGTNPIRPPEPSDGHVLQLQEIFPTLQGEGPLAGRPAVFVRLGGCNLACGFCDTEFESFQKVGLKDLVQRVNALSLNGAGQRVRSLAVITGGEPLRQNIAPLCEALLAEGFAVQIETNGTLFRALPQEVSIVVSPKCTAQGYARLRPDVLARADALKFLISHASPHYCEVGEVGQSERRIPVYVQPMDEQDEARNAANLALALSLAQTRGYRFSLQLHKLLGIP